LEGRTPNAVYIETESCFSRPVFTISGSETVQGKPAISESESDQGVIRTSDAEQLETIAAESCAEQGMEA
jgi:hypothetical protein